VTRSVPDLTFTKRRTDRKRL